MTGPAAGFGKFRERCRSLISWRAMLLIAVAVVGLLQLMPWIGATSESKPVLSASCAAWDREASEGIAALLPDGSAAAELRLDEAILQLRRARRLCRAGAPKLAEHDYASLQRSFPAITGSIRNAPAQADARSANSGE
jgi:hypothetical protein